MLLATGFNSSNSFFELIGMLIIFFLILGSAYWATRWFASNNAIQDRNGNIKVIETYRINSNKFIQIVKIGNKYIAIATCKEQIVFLTELEEETLEIKEQDIKQFPDFKEILTKVTNRAKSNKEKKG